jgi:hypothetical protein
MMLIGFSAVEKKDLLPLIAFAIIHPSLGGRNVDFHHSP